MRNWLKRRSQDSRFLGPFVGETTHDSAKLWIHTPLLEGDAPRTLLFTIHEGSPDAPSLATRKAVLTPETLGSATVRFEDLSPDTRYYYRIREESGAPLVIPDLGLEDLHFRTFPSEARPERFDFVLLSCHDPVQHTDDGHDGFGVWAAMDEIRRENDVRFAILAGDQIYGDHVQEKVLKAKTRRERIELYLSVYQRLWNHRHYRRALCSLPAYLMWDDHDITDGWGSRSDSYVDLDSTRFAPEWKSLFEAARECFRHLQMARNPEPLATGPKAGFDFCFKTGRAGFAFLDLRSHRNSKLKRVWLNEQLAAVSGWVERNRSGLDTLFVVSPVVFTHGWPNAEKAIRALKPALSTVMTAFEHIPGFKDWRWAKRVVERNVQDVSGFRDDLEDAWASDPNHGQAEQMLDFLFSLQNPRDGKKPLPVILLSGDIHAAGYSTLYSYKAEHQERPAIEHVVSSPVASKPMNELIEAAYQHQVKSVPIGTSGKYFGQVSHHHCDRNMVVLSLRRFGSPSARNARTEEMQLKVKYYLENRPQPEVILSDLNRVSRAEAIKWPSGETAKNEDPAQPSRKAG